MKYNQFTTEDFIKKSKEVHGNKYDYSKVEYVNARTKVCIICPEHGEFWQEPFSHTKGCECPVCSNRKTLTTEDFIKKSREVHGNKYDYSKVNYINNRTKVCIICPEHGEFWQIPSNHMKGAGCNLCKGKKISLKKTLTTEDFIKKSKEVHGDKYDYSKVEYTKARKKVCIICPKHGEFWQEPFNHVRGIGCPHCQNWRLEEQCVSFFNENNVKFERQKKFEWLKNKRTLRLDFYLPDYNIAIECQGKQHFKVIKTWGGKSGLENRQSIDKLKLDLCKKNGVLIEYVSYNENVENKLKNILKQWDNLLEKK